MGKKKQRFSADEKLQIVLECMRQDTSLSEVCRRYGIHHSDYYRWKDRVFSGAKERLKENGKPKEDPEKVALQREKAELERAMLDLTMENQILKKNER